MYWYVTSFILVSDLLFERNPDVKATSLSLSSQIFLNENYAAQDLMFWMEIEAFRGIPASQRHLRDVSAKHLRSKYFSRKYYFGPSSPASKEAQRQVYSNCNVNITYPVHKCSLVQALVG